MEVVFNIACKGAKKAKISGWVFHTGAGFDLRVSKFQDNLDSEETKFVNLTEKI